MAVLLKLRSSGKGHGHLLRTNRDATRKSVPWPQAPLPVIPMAKPNQKPKHKSLMQSLTVQPPQAQNWLELGGEWIWRGRWKLSSTDVVEEIPVLNGTSLSHWYYRTHCYEELLSLKNAWGYLVQAPRKCRFPIHPTSNFIFSVMENKILLQEAGGSVVDQL